MLSKRITIIWFGIIFIFSPSIHAQFTRFKHLTVDDGLTNNVVYAITQDSNGFIWCGTENGINKYDGYKVTKYPFNPEDSTGISSSQIRYLYADNDNKLWIGTFKGGLCCLDLSTNKFRRFLPDSLSKTSIGSDIVSSIVELDKNTLALATSNGLNFLNKNTLEFTRIAHSETDKNSILDNNIRAIAKDKNGNLWLAHYYFGLTYYDLKNKTFKRFEEGKDNKHLNTLNIRNILLDKEEILWISNWQGGINALDTKTNIFYNNRDTTSKLMKKLTDIGLVFSFYEDKNDNIWFCTAERGMCRYNKITEEKIFFKNNPDDQESFGDNTVFTVFEDKTGIIWAGTWRNGLNYFNKKSLLFGYYKHEKNTANSLVDKNVYCFEDIGNHEILIGTGINLCTFNTVTKKFTPFYVNKADKESVLENTQVNTILKDIDESIWIGSNGGGVYRYFPKTKKYKNYNTTSNPNSLSFHTELKILLDNSNNVWVVTNSGGMNLYDRKLDNFKRFINDPKVKQSIPSNDIYSIVKDKKGMFWMATESHGLIMLHPEKQEFTVVYHPKSEKSPLGLAVSYIFIDSENNFWLYTNEGLIKYNSTTRTAENFSEKIPSLKKPIGGILEDEAKNLWIVTSSELLKFNPITNNIISFYPEDGVQGKEFYPGSALKLKDGNLLLGGVNGFNLFNPKNIQIDTTPPSISFTGFEVLNKTYNLPKDISLTNEVTLSYLDYFFSFDFAAMDFSNPSQNKFKYKLEGFNDDWVDIGSQHNITFTNLDHGSYVLNIIAANKSGYWNKTPLQLKITITPPFWKTTWFYLLCIFSGIAAIYAFIKYREKQLIKDKTKLEIKVKERTEELREEKLKVEEAHKDIKDSIQYAQKIQSAILPSEEDLVNLLPGSFILFKPKDVVSGDFYWLIEKEGFVFYAVADCTGHGVPGGFMTMLSNGLLNELVNEHHVIEPGEILNKLREKIITSLKQTGKSGENKDGMDIVLFRINKKTNELCYAAANNGFIIINNGVITDYAGDKQPVGIYGDVLKPFNQFTVQLKKGDHIYSFTDGFPDQFGGPKGKKFKYKALNELLLSLVHLEGSYQKEKLEDAFNTWKGDLEQVDDVCVIGVKI